MEVSGNSPLTFTRILLRAASLPLVLQDLPNIPFGNHAYFSLFVSK